MIMQMSREEIVKSYKESKDKRHQIEVLADLNCIDKDAIRAILYDAGVPLPGKPKAQIKKPIETVEKKELEEPKEEPKNFLPGVIRDQLMKDADDIDKQIDELIKKKQVILDYVYEHI